jgi:hypothetical protein
MKDDGVTGTRGFFSHLKKKKEAPALKETRLLYINLVTLTWPQGTTCWEIVPETAGTANTRIEQKKKGRNKTRNAKENVFWAYVKGNKCEGDF